MEKVDSIFKTLGKSVALVFKSSPLLATLTFTVIVVNSLIPSALVVTSKDIINQVSDLYRGDITARQPLLISIAYWATLFLLTHTLGIVNNLLFGNLSDLTVRKIHLEIINKASSINDLYNFENSDFHDDLHILQTETQTRPVNLLGNIALNLKNVLVLISMLLILGAIHFSIPIILLVSAIPNIVLRVKTNELGWQEALKTSRNARLAEYFSKILINQEFIKESLLYNLGDYSKENYLSNNGIVMKQKFKVRNKMALLTLPATVVSVAGNIGVFYIIVFRITDNVASIGTLALFLQAFFQIQYHLSDLVQYGSYLQRILQYFQKFFSFLQWDNHISCGNLPIEDTEGSNPYLEFRAVSFSYPFSDKKVLNQVSFIIKEGESIAVVGENGAGKSTIVKLLLRFYNPTEGGIFYKGRPIEDFPIDEWRNQISCVFQDFSQYHIPLVDSITLGNRGKPCEKGELLKLLKDTALDILGEDESIEKVMIGKEFKGIELSGGEWQKLAVCRAIYRDSPLLILDEPTASLDPLAEAKIFQDFSRLSQNKTTFYITHRLGSTKDSGRIIVIHKGRVIERGTHKALLEHKGVYSKMYHTQKNQYEKEHKSQEGQAPVSVDG